MIEDKIIKKLTKTDTIAYATYLNITAEYRQNLPVNHCTNYKSFKELEDAGWYKFMHKRSTRFYHPALSIKNNDDASLIYKLALFDQYNANDINGKKLSDLIYVSDKWSKHRGMNDIILETISLCKVKFDYLPKQDCYTIRHNGSKVGAEIFSNLARIANLSDNKEYLKIMQYGPDHDNRLLVCHLSGQSMSNVELTNFETGIKSTQYSHQLHHALYDKTGSIYKIAEPSKLLGMKNFKNFTHEEHMELLGCIILSGDSHDAIHNSNKQDGIDNWFKRLEIKECYSLPYHWVSNGNYSHTLSYLSENTEYFDKDLALSYDDFIKKHSVATTITKSTLVQLTESNTPELVFDCDLLSKNHPSLQIPSPCSLTIGQQQTLDFEDKQPTCLYG
jgi:hypothetical protein